MHNQRNRVAWVALGLAGMALLVAMMGRSPSGWGFTQPRWASAVEVVPPAAGIPPDAPIPPRIRERINEELNRSQAWRGPLEFRGELWRQGEWHSNWPGFWLAPFRLLGGLLQLAGAIALIYLGVRLLRRRNGSPPPPPPANVNDA